MVRLQTGNREARRAIGGCRKCGWDDVQSYPVRGGWILRECAGCGAQWMAREPEGLAVARALREMRQRRG